jgi:hypothetical protein
MSQPETPEITAYALPDGRHWVFCCERCCRWHYHSPGPGRRVAHCHGNPDGHRDYVLTGGEPAPAGGAEIHQPR